VVESSILEKLDNVSSRTSAPFPPPTRRFDLGADLFASCPPPPPAVHAPRFRLPLAVQMPRTAATVRDIKPADFIAAYAEHLKKTGLIELPSWIDYAKSGFHKELSPYDPDWYFTRAAAIARKIYLRQHLGVGSLRKYFGSLNDRGTKTEHFQRAAGNNIRDILKQLEEHNVVVRADKGKGRIITSKGQKDLDLIASQVANAGAADEASDDDESSEEED